MWLPFLDNFVCFSANGMVGAMLEPHLKSDAGATQLQVALAFFISGGSYMVNTPIWGYVRSK